jgi:phage terminase small subunit
VNARQKKFAEFYAQSGNTVQSAIQAGYSVNYANTNACKLLENDRVSEYIKQLTKKEQEERIMGVCERQALLSDIARNENEKTQDRVKAIDTLNKMTGEYVTKIEGSISAEVNDPFKGLTTEELRKLAGE